MNTSGISGKGRGSAGTHREHWQGENAMSFGLQAATLYLCLGVIFSIDEALREALKGRIPEFVESVLSWGVALAYAGCAFRLVDLEVASRAGRRIRWHWGWGITPFVPATVLWIATYLDSDDTAFLVGCKILFFVGLSGFFFWLLYLSPLAERFARLESEDQDESAPSPPKHP